MRKYEKDEVAEINRGAVIVNGHAVYTLDYIAVLQKEIARLRDDIDVLEREIQRRAEAATY